MSYNFKPSYSIAIPYIFVAVPIVTILIVMCVMLFKAYKQSVEEEKNIQMTNAVQLRITDIESWLNSFFEIESNFNTSVVSFGMVNKDFKNKLFQKYITQKLKETPDVTSFWIWFAPTAFLPPEGVDSTFNYSKTRGFFMRCYKDKNEKAGNIYFQKLTAAIFDKVLTNAPIASAMANRESILSEPYICTYIQTADNSPQYVASFSSPILDAEKNIIGVTGFDIRLEDIAKIMNSLATNVYTKVCLFSKHGLYYSHFDSKRLGAHIKRNSIFSNQPNIIDSILAHTSNNTPYSVDVINEGLKGIDTTAWNNTIHFNNVLIKHSKDNYVTTAVFMPKAKFNINYSQFQQTMYIYALSIVLLIVLFIFALAMMCSNVLYNRMYININGLE